MLMCYVAASSGLLAVLSVPWFLWVCDRGFDAEHARVSRG